MVSRTSSVCSDKSGFGKSRVKQNDNATHEILSRQYLPSISCPRSLAKPSFPHRVIGTLSYINVEKNQFGVLVKHEKFDSKALMQFIHGFYCKEDENEDVKDYLRQDEIVFNCETCKTVPKSKIVIGGIYAALVDELKQIVRVRVVGLSDMNKTSPKYQVHVLDYGFVADVYGTQLMFLDKHYVEAEYQTAFALACKLPDARLLNGAPFPKLESFKLGDHVEVYVLSEDEPCLAVFGSLVTGPNSIPRELFSYGIAKDDVDSFNRAINGALSGEKETTKGWASNNWMNSNIWTLVTVASTEDLAKVAVRDVFASLKFLRLHQILNRSYRRAAFSRGLLIEPSKICSGSPVVVYYMPLDSYIRGTVTNVHFSGNACDIEAIDIPDLTVCDAPANMIFYPSSVLLSIPPQLFYVNLMKGHGNMKRNFVGDSVNKMFGVNFVALLKLSLDHTGAQLEFDKNNINDIIEECVKRYPVEDDGCDYAESHTLSRTSSWDDGLNF